MHKEGGNEKGSEERSRVDNAPLFPPVVLLLE